MALPVQKTVPPPPPQPAVVTYPAQGQPPPDAKQYTSGLKCVAVTEIVLGVLSIVCGAAATGVAGSLGVYGLFASSAGCWAGALLLAAGAVTMYNINAAEIRTTATYGNASAVLIMGFIAWMACVAGFGVSVAAAYQAGRVHGLVTLFSPFGATWNAVIALNAVVALFTFIGLIVTVFHIRFSCVQSAPQTIVMTTVPGQTQAVPVVHNQPGYVPVTQYQPVQYVAAPQPPGYQYPQQGTVNPGYQQPTNVPV